MSNHECHIPICLGRLKPHERLDYKKVLEELTKRIDARAQRVTLVDDRNVHACKLCGRYSAKQLLVVVVGFADPIADPVHICADFKDCDDWLAKNDEREARRVIAHMKGQADLG